MGAKGGGRRNGEKVAVDGRRKQRENLQEKRWK